MPELPVSLDDFAGEARQLLSPEIWDFCDGGSGTETTMAANRRALDAVSVYPRVLSGHVPETQTILLRSTMSMPVAVAPMAYQRLLHPDGELAMAEAAAQANIPMMLSTLSSYAIEEVAKSGVDLWFQLYWLRDSGLLNQLIERAELAGCRALVLTVDLPILGRRLRDVRNRFALPPEVTAANLSDSASASADSLAHVATAGRSSVAAHTGELLGPALGWSDLEWLRSRTELPIVVKGILDPRDARLAIDAGADAVVISNHGGRQLDGAPASIRALGEVIAEIGQQRPVLLDSGIRSGTDVLRALALGASAVLLGRPLLWALAVDGAAGVTRALSMLTTELTEVLTLAGCQNPTAARELRTHQEMA